MKKEKLGIVFIGSTNIVIQEVLDDLGKKDLSLDTMCIKAFPFHKSVKTFIDNHDLVYVIDQNRDAQLKSLLKLESNINEEKMLSIKNYNGVLITAEVIKQAILDSMPNLLKTSEASA
jgi:2-oxoglutarate ferredoxin oxidoreductase subunit alpha